MQGAPSLLDDFCWGLQRLLDFFQRVAFDDVARFVFVEVSEADAAFQTCLDFFHFILEAAEGGHFTVKDGRLVADDARLAAAEDFPVLHHAACRTALVELEDLKHFGVADDGFARFRFQKAQHGIPHLVNEFVNDGIQFYLHAFPLEQFDGVGFHLDVEAQDDGVRGGGQQNVRFRDGAGGGVQEDAFHFVRLDVQNSFPDGFHGTLHIPLQEYFELGFLGAVPHHGEQFFHACLAGLGQALLAKRMGKTEIIAETGAGQHGVASALASALLGLKCRIYMGAKDVERQSPNVFRMRLMGAEVIPVHSGSATLKDACNEALRDWSGSYETAHYMLGTAAGPHPFPTIVREFQRMIGEETKAQILEKEGRLPDAVIACVGGGSNAIGMFADFIDDTRVGLIGVEPAGHGIESGEHGAPLKHGRVGIYFGMKSPMMQTDEGQIEESYSISAGLDFPSVGPQHAYLNSTGRADYVSITDDEALEAFKTLCRSEGIIPALESSHALAHALKMMKDNPEKEQLLVVNLSGRGDKDIFTVHDILKARGEI